MMQGNTRLQNALASFRRKRGSLLPALHVAQEICGELSLETQKVVAEELDLPLAQVASVVSFYPAFGSGQGAAVPRATGDFFGAGILLQESLSDPASEIEYTAAGGYTALRTALENPAGIIGRVSGSGLLGRGGAAFPVGMKWKLVRDTTADEKFVICNASEGEPGTYKDLLLLCRSPHAILEGMAICGVAVGAELGILCISDEYPEAGAVMERALENACRGGYLGRSILGSGLHFEVELRVGAGGYASGEETGLIGALEGFRGEPRLKPPYPGVKGLRGKPTVINNAESFACVPAVLAPGGAEKCAETRLYTMSGCVKNAGVYERPVDATIRSLLQESGGGCPAGKTLKGIRVGGASGSIVGTDWLDVHLGAESAFAAGITPGTGSLLFLDSDTSVVALCRDSMAFFAEESCGKCTPCRFGCQRMLELLSAMVDGRGTAAGLEELETLSDYVAKNSLCGLGQTAPAAVTSALKSFRSEWEACVN